MRYDNNDNNAIGAMERHRTGNYGEDAFDFDEDDIRECPRCGTIYFDSLYVDSYSSEPVGCNYCLEEIKR